MMYLCHLLHILCPVQYSGSLVVLNCSNRLRPASKQKNCGPVFSECAMNLDVWEATFTTNTKNINTTRVADATEVETVEC